MTSRPETHVEPVSVTVVESPACHFCADAHDVLTALATEGHPLVTRTVDIRTEEGRSLITRHRAAMSPLVLVDGAFFSQGRLPRRKLLKLLGQRRPATRPATAG